MEDNRNREYSDMLFDMIEDGSVNAEELAKDLIYWLSEDDVKKYVLANGLIYEEDIEDDDLEEYI